MAAPACASAATVLLVAVLAGCGQTSVVPTAAAPSASTTRSPTPGPTIPPRPTTTSPRSAHRSPTLPRGATVRVLRKTLSDWSTGVELYPVGAHHPRVVAPATIYATMLFAGEPELRSHPSTIELARYRSSLNGGRIEFGDASSPHVVRSLLTWVVVYSGITPIWPDLGGPYRPSGAPTPSPAPVPTDCQWVYLASAVTGEYVSGFGDCPGELRPVRRR